MHATLCDFVLDIVQNSLEAGARIVRLDFHETENELSVRVRDDGRGMTEEERKKALDPFWTDGSKHAARRMGLGIPFLLQTLEMTGGPWALESEKGVGTDFSFSFRLDHVDTPPMGDTVQLFLAALAGAGDYEMLIDRTRRGRGAEMAWNLSRNELAQALGGLSSVEDLKLMRDFLASQEGA